MKLLIVTDAHIFVLPDNTYWCDSVETYAFWTRFLDVFDSLRIVARVKNIISLGPQYRRADGPNVEIWPVPFYQGPKQLIGKYRLIHQNLKGCYEDCSCALFRMPSQIGFMTLTHKPAALPYAGEIVYCQKDSVCGQRLSIRKILDAIISIKLKIFCKNANGVSYVTKETIQKYYPCHALKYGESERYFSSYYSTITLDDNAYYKPRNYSNKSRITLIISDAAMNDDRKGEITFISVVNELNKRGMNVYGVIIGDGKLLVDYKKMVLRLGLQKKIRFTGMISDYQILKKELIEADIYVLPTKGEGLPRGIIEAMALGMPVLSTPVGGIPEIIDNNYLFSPKDVQGFVDTIISLIENKDVLNQISKKNFEIAKEFNNKKLQLRRNEFYRKLALLTINAT